MVEITAWVSVFIIAMPPSPLGMYANGGYDCGVAVIVAVTGLLPVFTAVNEAMLPVPLAGKPIEGVLLTQLKVFAVPEKLMAVVAAPFAFV
jgi:phosphoribosylcarboxyaminoimidazole (NCAIR) mutase